MLHKETGPSVDKKGEFKNAAASISSSTAPTQHGYPPHTHQPQLHWKLLDQQPQCRLPHHVDIARVTRQCGGPAPDLECSRLELEGERAPLEAMGRHVLGQVLHQLIALGDAWVITATLDM